MTFKKLKKNERISFHEPIGHHLKSSPVAVNKVFASRFVPKFFKIGVAQQRTAVESSYFCHIQLNIKAQNYEEKWEKI